MSRRCFRGSRWRIRSAPDLSFRRKDRSRLAADVPGPASGSRSSSAASWPSRCCGSKAGSTTCISGVTWLIPSQSRSTAKGQFLFLGGRYVRDRSLRHALNEAYRGLLMVGRMPVAFLHLEIPPEQVDVNVHPTKVEVRFRDSQRVYSQLLSTLRQTFLKSDLHARLQAGQERSGGNRRRRRRLDRPIFRHGPFPDGAAPGAEHRVNSS